MKRRHVIGLILVTLCLAGFAWLNYANRPSALPTIKAAEQQTITYGYVDWATVALLIADYDPEVLSDDYFLKPYITFADTTASSLGLKDILEENQPGAMDLTETVVQQVHAAYVKH